MAIRHLNPEQTRWQVEWWEKGKRKRKNIYGTELEARGIEIAIRRRTPGTLTSSINSINHFIGEYLEWVKIHRSKKTYMDIMVSLKVILPAFGNIPVNRITPSLIDKFKGDRLRTAERTDKHRAINLNLIWLNASIKWGAERGYCDKLPFKIDKLKYSRPIPRLPSRVEVEEILSNIEPCYYPMLLCLVDAGLRVSEMLNLRPDNIINDLIIVKGKGDKERIIPLTERLKQALKGVSPSHGHLFINPKTQRRFSGIRKALMRACKKVGVTKRIHPHIFRHYFATCILERSELRSVQTLLGHAQITTTQFYTQISLERLKEVINAHSPSTVPQPPRDFYK